MLFRRNRKLDPSHTMAAHVVEVRRGPVSRKPIPAKLRFAILSRDHYTCQYCGAKGPQAGGVAVLEVDHRLPVSRGGTNDPANLVAACADCNRGKGAQLLEGVTAKSPDLARVQWETCRIEVALAGNLRSQQITIRADRYGAGSPYKIVSPKTFKFKVALPPAWAKHYTWQQYFPLLSERDKQAIQKFLDGIDRKLSRDGWQQVSAQEWRRPMNLSRKLRAELKQVFYIPQKVQQKTVVAAQPHAKCSNCHAALPDPLPWFCSRCGHQLRQD